MPIPIVPIPKPTVNIRIVGIQYGREILEDLSLGPWKEIVQYVTYDEDGKITGSYSEGREATAAFKTVFNAHGPAIDNEFRTKNGLPSK